MMSASFKLALVFVVLVSLFSSINSQTPVEPNNFEQKLTQAAPGETFLFAVGTYYTAGLNITVSVGISGAVRNQVQIVCTGGFGFSFAAGATITNMAFSNCGIGVEIKNGAADIAACDFYNNTFSLLHTGSDLQLHDSTFYDNVGFSLVLMGYGNVSSVTVRDNKATGMSVNSVGGTSGGGFTFTDCLFSSNNAAVMISGGDPIVFRNTTFYNNYAFTGGAIFLADVELTLANCTFLNNSGLTNGAALSSGGSKKITISNSFFTNNYVRPAAITAYSGSIINAALAPMTITDSTFTNSTGYNVQAGGKVTIVGCTFTRNVYTSVQILGSTGNITGSTFSYNRAPSNGGGFSAHNGTLIVTASTFNFNFCPSNLGGGGGYTYNTSLTVTNCTFTSNNATGVGMAGGGLHAVQSSTIITSSTFENNVANSGAGLSAYGGKITIIASNFKSNSGWLGTGADFDNGAYAMVTGSSFLGNKADGFGGGLYIGMNATMNMYSSHIDGNSANINGGGIHIVAQSGSGGAGVSVTSTTINYNTAQNGGGIFQTFSGGGLSLDNTDVSGNVALGGGGGGAELQSPSTIKNCRFEDNYATAGGGIEAAREVVSIDNTLFRNNSGSLGGALALKLNAKVTLKGSNITENKVNSWGGGIYIETANLTIRNTIFDGNTARIGGGMYHAGNSYSNSYLFMEMVSCEFKKNVAEEQGGGMYLIPTSYIYIGDTKVMELNNAKTISDGYGIYMNSSIPGNVIMRNVNLTTTSMANYCCGGTKKSVVFNEICNYPTCDSKCRELSNNCNCPFSATNPQNIIPTSNYTCTCETGWSGTTCTTPSYCTAHPGICDPRTTCIDNTASSYDCTPCPAGFNGTGKTGCQDINECDDFGRCDSHVNCTNGVGNYTCGPCPPGFSGSGYDTCLPIPAGCLMITCPDNSTCKASEGEIGTYSCVCNAGFKKIGNVCGDINECDDNNGGCDSHVICQNFVGGYLCPPCPTGTVGNSSQNCTKLCGNDACEIEIGENCVTCPSDCGGHGSACGKCGDGVCDTNENCTACLEDCQVALSCAPKCAACVHGTCDNKGVCICQDTWSGPACDVGNGGIVVVTNTTKPVTTITPASNPQILFNIGILAIQELSSSQQEVSHVDLETGEQNYTFVGNASNFDTNHSTTWTYSTMLSNKAVVNFTFYKIEEVTTITFADQNFTFQPHTLKFNVNVSSWPFKSLTNSLAVVLQSTGKGGSSTGENKCGGTSDGVRDSGDSDHLKWVKVTQNGVTLYGQFADAAIVDGRKRDIKYSLNKTSNLVSAILPHFWFNAVFDPAYSVLLEHDGGDSGDCIEGEGKKGLSNTVVIALSAGIGGGFIVVGAAIYTSIVVRKRRNNRMMERAGSGAPLKKRRHT